MRSSSVLLTYIEMCYFQVYTSIIEFPMRKLYDLCSCSFYRCGIPHLVGTGRCKRIQKIFARSFDHMYNIWYFLSFLSIDHGIFPDCHSLLFSFFSLSSSCWIYLNCVISKGKIGIYLQLHLADTLWRRGN